MRAYFDIEFSEIDSETMEEGSFYPSCLSFEDGCLQVLDGGDGDWCFVPEDNAISGRYRGVEILQVDGETGEEEWSTDEDYDPDELFEMFDGAVLTAVVIDADDACDEALNNAKLSKAGVTLYFGEGKELEFESKDIDLEVNW